MIFNSIQFLKDYGIICTTDHHHCKSGNVNIHCPFCAGKNNFHLGIFPEGNSNCWRCGKHSLKELIQKITKQEKVTQILFKYKGKESRPVLRIPFEAQPIQTNMKLPYGTDVMTDRHRKYLESRNFDSEKLEKEWGLKGSGIFGLHRNRIIAPIYLNHRLVSYQSRDITELSSLRYKACAKRDEVVHHKHTLYGIDKVKEDRIIVVEGITDVWRLGAGAVSTFGIEWTRQQLFLLSQFKTIFIWYDNQEQATMQAEKLASELAFLSDVNIVEGIEGKKDPAELSQEQADGYMKELIGLR